MANIKSPSDVKEERAERARAAAEKRAKDNEKVVEARKTRKEHLAEVSKKESQRVVAAAEKDAEAIEEEKAGAKVHELSGKPGSGAGLKPGDWFAPASNPGAAARVPSQPLQPESLQSHGKGIIYDKDLENPPYDAGDPMEVDAPPSGILPSIDKAAEVEKQEKMSSRAKLADPDNPTVMAGGKPDATASPNPIGSRGQRKADTPGGSNPGSGR